MKKILFSLFVSAGAAVTLNAKVLTVSNHTLSAGKYTKIQEAVDAAAVGDTIYVHGSTTSYGDVKINKRLVLIGAGHNLKETQHNLNVGLNYIYLESTNSSILSSGTIIKGFSIYSLSGTASNILIERNRISYITVGGDGWLIRNNFIDVIGVSYAKNIIISNNILSSVSGSDKPSVIITNNVMIGGAFSSVSYATITNNIFIERRSDGFTGSQNTYNKNISIYWDQINFYTLPPALNSGVGNLNTVDSQFMTDITGKSFGPSEARNFDWRLNATSLGVKYGTDGTDCGIYGGSYPMPNMTGATTLPQVISVDIQNSVIPVGGTLNVELKAKSQK
jgi:hypothetical protein